VANLNGEPLTHAMQERLWETAKKKQTSYGEIVSQAPIVEMLIDSWFLRKYFATSALFKPKFLHDTISVYGGVSPLTINVMRGTHCPASYSHGLCGRASNC
jgi:hypothetical protein